MISVDIRITIEKENEKQTFLEWVSIRRSFEIQNKTILKYKKLKKQVLKYKKLKKAWNTIFF